MCIRDSTGANVGGNYVGNFSDEATGKVLGNALIAEGVDILFVAAGGSGNGVFTAAKEAEGVKVIGCDVDQYDDGANGDSNIVLTSGLKVMHDTVYNVLNEVKDGSFKGANAVSYTHLIGNLAQENPDTKFILIDSWPTVDGTEVTADQVIDNVYAAYYAEQESGFLSLIHILILFPKG